jgi:hypothetical protein
MGVSSDGYEAIDLDSHAPWIECGLTDRGLLFLCDRLRCMGDREKWSLNALRVAVHGRGIKIVMASRACSHAPYGVMG